MPTSTQALEPNTLLADAKASTGLTDFGKDLSFMAGMEAFVSAIEAMNPAPEFREAAKKNILALLEARLRYVEDERLHPEILDVDVGDPLIVCGLPRTGTTITYDLLCLDPASRAPREWEWLIPWPAPEEATFDTDPRIATVQAKYDIWLQHAPQLADIQRLDCTQPGECNHGMMMHFASTNFPAEYEVPEYGRWLRETEAEGQYRTHKRMLQQFQWKGPKGRWTLKSPQHLFDLPGLIETYPGAMLVWTHRDPALTFSSLASMIVGLLAPLGQGSDKKAVGRFVFETWATALERGTAARASRPDIEERIIDLGHKEVVADPEGSVKRIYERFGLPYTQEHSARIVDFVANSAGAARLGRHKHSPEEYGIDRDEVRSRLSDYYERFGHLLGPADKNGAA